MHSIFGRIRCFKFRGFAYREGGSVTFEWVILREHVVRPNQHLATTVQCQKYGSIRFPEGCFIRATMKITKNK